MRLDQFLSARTMYSRRELRQMIQKGKATVDGAVVRKADQHVQPDENTVCLNGRHIPGDQYLYVLLHKPKGYVSSADEPGQKSVLELVPPELCRKDLRPVGRLDKDSTGMLLLTDDGQLAHQVIAARSHVDTIISCWLAPGRTAMRKRWQRAWCWRTAHSACRQRLPRWRAQTVRR